VILLSCSSSKEELTVLTASGLREPFSKLVENYQKIHPEVNIKVIYGGSGNLLALLSQGQGDIFIPAGEYYIEKAKERNLIDSTTVKVIAQFVPVLVVKKELLQKVSKLEDLTKFDLKIGIGDPKAASIGRVSKKILENLGIWEKIQNKIAVRTATVSQLLIYLKTKQVDAAIIWKHLAKQLKDYAIIPIPQRCLITEKVEISVASFTKNRKLAEDFENYIEKHKKELEKYFQ